MAQPAGDRQGFLEVLTAGKLSLYRYNDEKVHYFARKAGGDWQEFPLYTYILKRNRTRSLVQMEVYKDQLALLLADCPPVAESARKTAYAEAALAKIVRAYNACMGERAAPVAPLGNVPGSLRHYGRRKRHVPARPARSRGHPIGPFLDAGGRHLSGATPAKEA